MSESIIVVMPTMGLWLWPAILVAALTAGCGSPKVDWNAGPHAEPNSFLLEPRSGTQTRVNKQAPVEVLLIRGAGFGGKMTYTATASEGLAIRPAQYTADEDEGGYQGIAISRTAGTFTVTVTGRAENGDEKSCDVTVVVE